MEELGLTYETHYLDFKKNEQKDPAFIQYNPNGRIPVLIDHTSNDFVVWLVTSCKSHDRKQIDLSSLHRESNAILQYLVEKYDTEHKISAASFEDKTLQLQWLFFQASGQGYVTPRIFITCADGEKYLSPYFGQAGWFMFYHPEKLPSALERYQKEILRVFGVLNGVLATREWLVGGKCTIADLSFVT